MAHSTEPSGDRRGLPVRTLEIEVVDGLDAGVKKIAESETLTIGTADGNDLVLTDPTVSRFHLELVAGGEGIRIEDHGSTNGTVFEGARIVRGTLPSGATLTLGKTKIRVGDGERVRFIAWLWGCCRMHIYFLRMISDIHEVARVTSFARNRA